MAEKIFKISLFFLPVIVIIGVARFFLFSQYYESGYVLGNHLFPVLTDLFVYSSDMPSLDDRLLNGIAIAAQSLHQDLESGAGFVAYISMFGNILSIVLDFLAFPFEWFAWLLNNFVQWFGTNPFILEEVEEVVSSSISSLT